MLFVVAAFMIAGCASEERLIPTPTPLPQKSPADVTKTPESIAEKQIELTVYYFYHPQCPNCQAVEPVIDYLLNNTNISFDICNVEHFSNCSNMSKQLVYSVRKKTGFFGTPTAVVQENGRFKVFIGKYQVVEMVNFLRNFTYIPDISLKNTSMGVDQCLSCHEKRGLKPPSTMTCSYCCHGVV